LPNIKSAIKRVNVNRAKREQNTMLRSALKTTIKKCKAAIESSDGDRQEVFSKTVSAIDKAAAKKLIHRNTAARKKSKLARALKAASSQ